MDIANHSAAPILRRNNHTLLHHDTFNIHVEDSKGHGEPQLAFSTPSGQKIEASFFPQFPEQAPGEALQSMSEAAPEVNNQTAVTQ